MAWCHRQFSISVKKRTVHKDVQSSAVREGGVVQSGHFSDKESSSDADVRIFDAKNFAFFGIYGVSAVRTDIFRTRGRSSSDADASAFLMQKTSRRRFEPLRNFSDKEVNFSRFCADVLYGWLQTFFAVYFLNKVVIQGVRTLS